MLQKELETKALSQIHRPTFIYIEQCAFPVQDLIWYSNTKRAILTSPFSDDEIEAQSCQLKTTHIQVLTPNLMLSQSMKTRED